MAVLVANAPYSPSASSPSLAGLPAGRGTRRAVTRRSPGQVDSWSRSRPGPRRIPVRSATCAPGSATPSVSSPSPQWPSRSAPIAPRVSLVDRPADRVLHPRAPLAVRHRGVHGGEVVDDVVAGAVDGDQHVGAPRCGDLGERGAEDRDVIAGGERPGVARAQHHREALADGGGPGGQRVEPEALLVGPRRLILGTGDVEQGGVQADHQHRTWPRTGGRRRAGEVGPGDCDGGQLPVPGHHPRPGLRPRARGGPGQPSPGQTIGAQPRGQLVEHAEHRGVRRPTTGPEDLLLCGHRLDVAQARRARGQRARCVHQRPASMAQRDKPRPGHHRGQVGAQPEPAGQQPRCHHPGRRDRPGPADLDRQRVRPPQRGIHNGPQTPCTIHLEGAPSCEPIRSSTTRILPRLKSVR